MMLPLRVGVPNGYVGLLCRQTRERQASEFIQGQLTFSYFLGGSFGTLAATWAWSHTGWNGVCGVAVVFLVLAVLSHFAIGEPEKLATD